MDHAPPPPPPAPPDAALSIADGLYFATASTPDGPRGWLVRIDGGLAGMVRLYAPPDNPVLAQVAGARQGGEVELRSAPGLGDLVFVLTGRAGPDALHGHIETRRTSRRGDSLLTRDEVQFRRVPEADGPLIGLFSNVTMHEGSGDPQGSELVLLEPTPGRPAAVLTSYDGELVPYAATDVARDGAGLRFTMRTAAGAERYVVAPAGDGVTLRGTDGDTAPLERRVRLGALLREAPRP